MPSKIICLTSDKMLDSDSPSRSLSKDSLATDAGETTRAPSRADPNSESEDDELLDMRILPRISERRASEMTCTPDAEIAVRLALQRSSQPQCLSNIGESARTMGDVVQEAREKCGKFATKACHTVAASIANSSDTMKLGLGMLAVLALARVLSLCGLLTNPCDVFLLAFLLGGLTRFAMVRYGMIDEDAKHHSRFGNRRQCGPYEEEGRSSGDVCPYSANFWADLPDSKVKAAGDEAFEVTHASDWAKDFLLGN